MFKKCVILLMALHCVLSKSIAEHEKAEVPIERSSVHFSYGLSPVQMFAVRQIPGNKMPGHVVLHTSQPVHFYHPVPTSSHIGYVNAIQNPAYLSVLNNPKIKTGYSFMFSSPHHVKFHDVHEQQEAKMEFINKQVQVDTLQGQFADFIITDNEFRPENIHSLADGAKLLINTVEGVTTDTTEATTLATTQQTTTVTSTTQGNEDKMEGVKTDLLNVETLHGKFENFIHKDPPPFINGQSTDNLNSDVTEATSPVATQATSITAPSNSNEMHRGDMEYDIDIRKDDE